MKNRNYGSDDGKRHELKRLKDMCVAYSNTNAHHVSYLPEEVYEKSLYIPPEGIIVKRFQEVPPLNSGEDEWAFPVIRGGVLTAEYAERLGTYSVKDDIIQFVDREGDTYVSPCPSVLKILKRNRFREIKVKGSLPLARGGRPSGIFYGEDYKNVWSRLIEISYTEIAEIHAQLAQNDS